MFGGGGGMNPRKMKQMMEQMGIDVEEIETEEVVIRTTDGKELVFDDADVTRMDARGQQTYQVIGEPEERESTASAVEAGTTESGEAGSSEGESGADEAIPQDDVDLVAQRAGVSEDEARDALREADGDLAAAIDSLE